MTWLRESMSCQYLQITIEDTCFILLLGSGGLLFGPELVEGVDDSHGDHGAHGPRNTMHNNLLVHTARDLRTTPIYVFH